MSHHDRGSPNQSEPAIIEETRTLDKLLLTPPEAAAVLSIGRSKLYELLAEGHLDAVRVGSCRRIPIGSLIDFVSRLQIDRAARHGPAAPDLGGRTGSAEGPSCHLSGR